MKILITGANGMLAKEVKEKFEKDNEIITTDVNDLDITDEQAVMNYITKVKPDYVINCAAYTAVDKAEENYELADRINGYGPANLAKAAKKARAKLVHISTDYVFGGNLDISQDYSENDAKAPVTVYGKTKLHGEQEIEKNMEEYYIFRTAWLYGKVGKNFVYTMENLGKTKEVLTVVDDQRGNPTNANDLAYHILKLIQTEEYGIYHCTGNGECSWYDFASLIMELSGRNCKVNPCTSEEYAKMNPASAKRPEYSSLDNMMLRCTVGDEMRDWKDALKSFLKDNPNI